MTKKERLMDVLERMGYSPEIDEDGDIRLCYQIKTVYVMTGEEDEPYVCMMLPQFYEIKENQETLVLAVCNKMSRELKLATVFVDQTFKNVSATCEFFYVNDESLEQNFNHSLRMFGVVRTMFKDTLTEISKY